MFKIISNVLKTIIEPTFKHLRYICKSLTGNSPALINYSFLVIPQKEIDWSIDQRGHSTVNPINGIMII